MRHLQPLLIVAATFLASLALATVLLQLRIAWGEVAPLYGLAGVFLLGGLRLHMLAWTEPRPVVRRWALAFADVVILTALFYMVAATAALCSAALATTGLPYADDALAAADRAFGFDWLAAMAWFQSSPRAAAVLIEAYLAINWQPQLAILLLCTLCNRAQAYRFVTAWSVCLLLTVGCFPFFPAIAAFQYYGVDAQAMPGATNWMAWRMAEVLEPLRDGSDTVLGAAELTGIITMPSFHAAAAILLMFGFWPLRWLRWPAIVLNALMFASAVPVGAHYMVDTLAGLALALAAIAAAMLVHGDSGTSRLAAAPA